ncbi:MAG: type II toxin-antitoxin system RelB/DinJ family antitoxin [Acutalibacteraceae bacterium]
MAEQALIQFRADKALKQEVTEIYEALGMDLPTAFRMFMTRTKQVRGLPFDAKLPENTITAAEALNAFDELRKQAADVPEMTLDEINAEIAEVRAARKVGKE